MKKAAHPMDRTANWCSHGGRFTLVGKCKLSSFVHFLLSVFRLLFTERTLFGPKILDLIWAISSQADRRIGHNICKMHNLIVRVLNACARVVVGLEERCSVCSWTVISHSGREYVFVGNYSLVHLYAKYGSMKDAGRLFNENPSV
jgi:hypothetical protein